MNMETDSTTTISTKPIETVHTSSLIVSCEGNHPNLGHPHIYLKLKNGQAKCPYCSKVFIFESTPQTK